MPARKETIFAVSRWSTFHWQVNLREGTHARAFDTAMAPVRKEVLRRYSRLKAVLRPPRSPPMNS